MPSQKFNTQQAHLLVQGQISFVNSFGFLNADQYPLMQFFLVMFFIYFCATGYWIYLMRKNPENRVSIHFYFGTLIFCTMIECAITYTEYE